MNLDKKLSREQLLDRAGMLRERISALSGDRVEIVAVTKGFGSWALRLAAECGFRNVGENYAQELKAKWSDLNEDQRRPWTFISSEVCRQTKFARSQKLWTFGKR